MASADDLLDWRLPQVFLFQKLAENHRLDDSHPSLSLDAVVERLCAQVIFDPSNETDFPSGIQPGQAGTLNVRVGYAVDEGAPRFDTALDITVTSHGAEPDAVVEGTTSADGRYTRQFLWDPTASQLRLDISACLHDLPVCQDAFVIRGAPSTVPPPTAVAGECPVYTVIVNGIAQSTNSADGLSVGADNARGAALATKSFILNAFDGGRVEAGIKVRYAIDAPNAGGASFPITLAFYGRVQDASGAMAKVTLQVGNATRSFTSPKTDINGVDVGVGTLEIPVTVVHGQVVEVELKAEAASTGGRTTLTGGLQFLNRPDLVFFNHATCP
jgi:hypothetical protein